MSEINEDVCSVNYKPTGESGCATDLTIAARLYLFKTGVNFATIDDAKSESALDTLIQDGDVIVLPLIFNAENSDKEGAIDEGATGQSHKVSDGTGQNTYYIVTSGEMHNRIRSYDQFEGGYMIIDKNENCKCYSPDGVQVNPLTIGTCSVGIHVPATDATASYTPIFISDKYPKEWNDNSVTFKPDYIGILGKNGLLPVRLAIVGTPTATEIVVNATVYNTGSAVSGLETATDWVVGTGSVTTSVESETTLGQYTLTGTGFATGTLNLGDSSVLSVTGYSSNGEITLTVA